MQSLSSSSSHSGHLNPDVVILPVAHPYKLAIDPKLRKILTLAGLDTSQLMFA